MTSDVQVAAPRVHVEDGDHDRFTHIVLEGFTPDDGEFVPLNNSVIDAMVTATPIRALCGKVWVPNGNPERYPVCPTCAELATSMGWSLPPR